MFLRRALSFLFIFLTPLLLAMATACSSESPTAPVETPTELPSATPVPTSTPVPTPTPRPPPPRPEANAFPPDLTQRAQTIFDAVSKLRGTPRKSDIDMYLMTRAQARAFYAPRLDEDAMRDPASPRAPRLDAKTELYRLLGLVPDRQDTNVAQQSTDNLISLITGFYSPEYKAFYMLAEISGGVTGNSALATIAHEYVHALQDQYYDIDGMAAKRGDDWDGVRTLQDVMEGDAIHYENAYMGFSLRSTYRVPVCFKIPAPQRGVPFVIERELDTWYEDGLCFFDAVLPQLPNGATSLWEDLPTTTEQILHPEKYLAHEAAKPVSLQAIGPVLGSGWSELDHSNFGEFSLQNLLLVGQPTNRTGVQQAAAGWGGDAWALYTKDDARLMQAVTVWDTPEDATEFVNALILSLRNLAGSGADVGPPGIVTATVAGKTWRVALNADRVSFLVSNDLFALDVAAKALGMP